MSGPTQIDLQKLAKICARFGSDFPEERATAAAIADKMVREAGHSWEILFRALEQAAGRISQLEEKIAGQPEWHPVSWVEPETYPEAIERCLDWAHIYTDWERNFLVSVSGRQRLSPKQRNVIMRLVEKAKAATLAGMMRE